MKYQFRQVINQLKSFTSEFYFTSGYACYLYKIRSYYNDIDICVSQDVFNKIPKIFPQAKIKNITNDIRSFTLNTDKGEIEFAKFDKFFNKKGNINFFGFDSKVTDDLLEIEIENQKCKIILIDWLIILKLISINEKKKRSTRH